jgi:hypothetical protein
LAPFCGNARTEQKPALEWRGETMNELKTTMDSLRRIQTERIAYLLAQLTGEETQVDNTCDGLVIHWPIGGGLISTRLPWRQHPESWICRTLEVVAHKLGIDPLVYLHGREADAEYAVENALIARDAFPGSPAAALLLAAETSPNVTAIGKPIAGRTNPVSS